MRKISKLKRKFEDLVDNSIDNMVDKLSKTDIKIYSAIKENPYLSQPELAKKCGVGKTTVQNTIVKLKKNNLIERVASNKTGYWKVRG